MPNNEFMTEEQFMYCISDCKYMTVRANEPFCKEGNKSLFKLKECPVEIAFGGINNNYAE